MNPCLGYHELLALEHQNPLLLLDPCRAVHSSGVRTCTAYTLDHQGSQQSAEGSMVDSSAETADSTPL